MSLEQLSDLQRILFLQEFTAEIVTHSAEDERLKHLIKVERIKRKIMKEPEKDLEQIGKSVIFNQYQKSTPIKEFVHFFNVKSAPQKNLRTIKPIIRKNQNITSNKIRNIEEIINEINKIINDKSVQMIECPGSGRNILVKVRNKVNLTKIILNESEIKNVINYFSDLARIPIIGGVLKASVDSSMISAIISDGNSRFIINKKSPYNLIENPNDGEM